MYVGIGTMRTSYEIEPHFALIELHFVLCMAKTHPPTPKNGKGCGVRRRPWPPSHAAPLE